MYKYKSGNIDYDIPALLNDSLWVSTFEKMNDPMDLGFYITDKRISNSDIRRFQDNLNKSFVVISLATKVQNKRLWNYYTNGMRGFVLQYRKEDLVKALKNAGAENVYNNKVEYSDTKVDLTVAIDEFLKTNRAPVDEYDFLFSKDDSWSEEDEYRIVTNSRFLHNYDGAIENGGICINGVIPTKIIVGYKMETDVLEKIIKYSKERNIELRRYIPDFYSRSKKAYTSEVVFEGKTME